MAVDTTANLLVRANAIRTETAGAANSASRVGGLLRDMIDSLEPINVAPSGTGADDTSAIQAAVDAANAAYVLTGAVQTVRFLPGLYGVKPGATKSWDIPIYAAGTAEVHIGVILKSGVDLDSRGATFTALPPTGAQAGWYYALFGSEEMNASNTALEKISMRGASFLATDADWSQTYFTLYGVLLVGVDGLVLDQCEMDNGDRASPLGRMARVMNSRNVRIHDFYCRSASQCIYVNYIDGLHVSGFAEDFGEVLDIDQYCRNVDADITCRDGHGNERGQVFDISAVVNGQFRCRAYNCGTIAIIYAKADSPPTFAEWVVDFPLGTPATNPVIPENISLEVEGTDIYDHSGSDGYRAIQVAANRDDPSTPNYWDGKAVLKNIRIRANLVRTDPITVFECDGLDLIANMSTCYCSTVDRVNNAAVVLRQARGDATKTAESKLSGRALLNIQDSEKTGVRVSIPTDFHLEATVNGYNTTDDATSGVASGVHIEGLNRKVGTLTIANIRTSNGDTTVTPVGLRMLWDGSLGLTQICDLGGHRLTEASTPCNVGATADAGYFTNGWRETVVTFDTVTNATHDLVLGVCSSPGARLAELRVFNDAAITGDAVDFSGLTARRLRAGAIGGVIGSAVFSYDAANIAAGVLTDIGMGGADTDGLLVAGDAVVLRAVRNGTGSTQTVRVQYRLVEYTTT